jgi:hypothetical protein
VTGIFSGSWLMVTRFISSMRKGVSRSYKTRRRPWVGAGANQGAFRRYQEPEPKAPLTPT